MTFEEFFAKKKIDLDALAKAEPELFSEFKSHYNLMGERSFDHTKKFWFNKLRRLYHLSTAEKAITQLETKIASQAEPLSSPTIEQKPAALVEPQQQAKSIARPAFKPRNIPAAKVQDGKEETPVTENTEAAASPVKKPGFKPRNIKPADREAEDAKSLESRPGKTEVSDTPVTNMGQAGEDAPKPAYRPKFSMRNVPRNPGGAAEQTGDSREEKIVSEPEGNAAEEPKTVDEPKPAYKPKFNLKNIAKAKAEESVTEQAEDQTREGQAVPPPEQSNDQAQKPAYKPRFNMKNLPQQKSIEKAEDEQLESSPSDSISSESQAPEVTGEVEPTTKPAYKPRFNMKNLPKVKDEETPIPASEEENKPQEAEKEASKSDVEALKPAYKPRFNIKNLPKLKSEEEPGGASEPAETKEEEVKGQSDAQNDPEPPAAKPAYKPKFNMRNIKPKPPGSSE